MNDQQNKEGSSGVRYKQIRVALDQHWAESDANDFETGHLIYHEGTVLEFPHTVSIMEFRGDKVWRETQCFADPFVAPASRAQWIERMDA